MTLVINYDPPKNAEERPKMVYVISFIYIYVMMMMMSMISHGFPTTVCRIVMTGIMIMGLNEGYNEGCTGGCGR